MKVQPPTVLWCAVLGSVNDKMNTKIQFLLAVVTAASGSFLQAPSNQFQLTFNSTFLTGNERLFKPIVIPNTTRTQQPVTDVNETSRTKAEEPILKKILHPQESASRENYLREEPKPTRFSSRYSTKLDYDSSEKVESVGSEKSSDLGITQIPRERFGDSRRDETSTTETHKPFLDHSDDSEEKDDKKEIRDESENSLTTSEPYSELQRPTSFGNSDEDRGSYETTSSAEETDSSEEDEEENKRSVGDYYNSDSKNYHSIQTPLDSIKYRGAHIRDDDFVSEKTRTRLVDPIRRHPISHNWPYSRAQVKAELEKLNEISDSDESYEKALDEGIEEEVKTKPKQSGLELAVEKDEIKFDRNKKYNYVEERNRKKQQQKGLVAEEEKDDSSGLLQTLKQYQVDEEPPKHQPKVSPSPKLTESIWSTTPPHVTTLKNTFKTPESRTQKKVSVASNLTPNLQGHQFLGPVVFSQNEEQQRIKPLVRKAQLQKHRSALKGLLEREKLDQDNLTNQRFQKSIFGTENKLTQTFNHVEESNEMYNAILANIQSVFGLRTEPLKGSGSQRVVSSDDSKSLTWSSPLKTEKAN